MSSDLGFNNTYALVMRRAEASQLGINQSAICTSTLSSRLA